MENTGRSASDTRFNIAYNMNILSGEQPPDIYSSNPMNRIPSSGSLQQIPRHTMITSMCGGNNTVTNQRSNSGLKSATPESCYDEQQQQQQQQQHHRIQLTAQHPGAGLGGLGEPCGVSDIDQDTYTSIQPKKSPPSNGKKTKGRVKIKMEYIENKLRRYTTFSKRKTGIMKKAYELSTLTGTQVMLLVASETGHVYTFATRKLQPMITSEAGKALIQTCLNSPDPAGAPGTSGADQRMSATGFEETELTYNISDDDTKDDDLSYGDSSDSGSGPDSPGPSADNEQFEFTNIKNSSTKTSTCQNNTSSNTTAVTNNTTTTLANGANTNSTQTLNGTLTGTLPPGITVYQTPSGAMYAAPTGTSDENHVLTGAGVVLSLQNGPPGAPPQFITIPLMGPPSLTVTTASASTNSSLTTTTTKTSNNQEINLSIKTERLKEEDN